MDQRELMNRLKSITRAHKFGTYVLNISCILWLLGFIFFSIAAGSMTAEPTPIEDKIYSICGLGMMVGVVWLIMTNSRMTKLMCEILKASM